MFKYRRIVLYTCTFLYILFYIIELFKYMFVSSNYFGLVYLINNLFIIFLLVPCTYNYKKYYSLPRISKLIIIILFGIFNSYFLQKVMFNNMDIIDSSKIYIDKIIIYKNYLKGIIYFILSIITFFEFRGEKLFKSIVNK